MRDTIFVNILVVSEEFAGINDNFNPAIVVFEAQIQDQDASLRRDCYLHFPGDGKAVSAVYLLCMEKQCGKLAQAGNLSRIQTAQELQPLKRRPPKIVRNGLVFKNTVLIPPFEIPVHAEPPVNLLWSPTSDYQLGLDPAQPRQSGRNAG